MLVDAGGRSTPVLDTPPGHGAASPTPATPKSDSLARPMSQDSVVLGVTQDLLKGAAASPNLDIAKLQDAGILPKGHLDRNATYHAGPAGNYTVKTDTFGRLKSIEGDLVQAPVTPKGQSRSSAARSEQRAAAERGGLNTQRTADGKYDLGFHLIGDRNGVESAPHTLVPGNADLNVSDYKRLENSLNRSLDSGRSVHVKASVAYNDGTNRPAAISVESKIAGEEFTSTFANRARLRDASGAGIPGSTKIADLKSVGAGSEAGLEGALKFAKGADILGKVATPLAIAGDVINIGSAYQADGDHIGKHTVAAVGSAAGGWAGAVAGGEVGAELGGTIGSIIPGAGTVVGGVIGGLVGGAIGGLIGSGVGAQAAGAIEDVGSAAGHEAKKRYTPLRRSFNIAGLSC